MQRKPRWRSFPVGFAVAAIFAAWGLVVLAIDGRHLTPVVVTFSLPPCFALGVELMARRARSTTSESGNP